MSRDECVKVDTLLKAIYDGEYTVPYQATYDGTTVSLFSSAGDLLEHMSMLFGSYLWFPSVMLPATAQGFVSLWSRWLTRNAENIVRQFNALAEEYNPIHNYDLTEAAADGSRRSKDTQTVTPSGTMSVASAHTGTDTTTEDRYGFDSSTGAHADKSTLSHGETVTDTTSFNQYKTETETTSANDQSITLPDGTTGTGYDVGSEHYLHRYGNIGVQTAADILSGELEVRTHDLSVEWVQRFGNQYFVYVG